MSWAARRRRLIVVADGGHQQAGGIAGAAIRQPHQLPLDALMVVFH